MAIRITFHPATEADKEIMPELRDNMCNALCGWKPFVDSDVLVGDGDAADGSIVLVIGPDTPGRDCDLELEITDESLPAGGQ